MDEDKDLYPMTKLIGPMVNEVRFVPVVDGFQVPYLKVVRSDEEYTVILDDRIATEYLPLVEVRRWLPFVANCMAFAAGYASHGQREKHSPFAYQAHEVGDELKRPELQLVPSLKTEKGASFDEDLPPVIGKP